jgi:hypothetical protein
MTFSEVCLYASSEEFDMACMCQVPQVRLGESKRSKQDPRLLYGASPDISEE